MWSLVPDSRSQVSEVEICAISAINLCVFYAQTKLPLHAPNYRGRGFHVPCTFQSKPGFLISPWSSQNFDAKPVIHSKMQLVLKANNHILAVNAFVMT